MQKIFLVLLLILVCCLILPLQVFGEPLPDLDYQDPEAYSLPGIGSLLLRFIVSLAVVVILAFVVVRLLQRKVFIPKTGTWLRVIDQAAIGPNKGLLLAEVCGKFYVFGVTDHDISKLLEIEDPEEIAAILASEDQFSQSAQQLKTGFTWLKTDFQKLLQKEQNRAPKKGDIT